MMRNRIIQTFLPGGMLVVLFVLFVPSNTVRAETIIASGGDTYCPFHYVENGEATGFDVELLQAISRTMNIDLEVRLAPWHEAREGLADGSILVHVGMTISPERAQEFRFATPHLNQQYKIFVRRDAEGISTESDLYGKRIIVQREGVMSRYVVSQEYTDKPLLAANAEEAMGMLAAGQGDACLMSELRGLHVIDEMGLKNLERVGDPVYQTYYGFAVVPGHENLVPLLNQGLTILKESGEYDAIYDKWFGVLQANHLSTWDYLKYAGWVIVPLLLAFLVASLWSWTLRRQVVRQTRDLRQARDQAEAASEAKSRFLATMSHEIRTPLNGVMGMSQILMTSGLNEDQADQVNTISKSAEALQEIITDILDFSRIEAGERSLESIEFRPRQLIADTFDIIRPAAKSKGLELRLQGGDELPAAVLGDPTALRQILLNLLGNAVKFTEKGFVQLKVRTARLSDTAYTLEIEVEDTGIGLPQDVGAELFEAFTQADTSTTRRFGGTGLGLAICKNLLDLMGSRIGVRARDGGGSVFHFKLELGAAKTAVKDSNDDSPNTNRDDWDPAGLRVLLVEDNVLNQRVMKLLLKKFGVKMTLASDGQDALDICTNATFDAILMDCQMPRIDGFEATRQLRKREGGGPRTPIIALTAGAFETDRERCLACGMDDYLTKPVNGKLLLQVLQKQVPGHLPLVNA
jgi:signal transduction histidine kinase/ActR/RegA family two-component response regulator